MPRKSHHAPYNAGVTRVRTIADRVVKLDEALRSVSRGWRIAGIAATLLIMVWQSLPHVPKPFADYSQLGWLGGISQPVTYGTDTIADTYEAKVVLNDPADMYVKAHLDQTAEEAATWSKAASAPYPPVVLLVEAALYSAGSRLGIGLYGMILLLAALFVGASAWYFLQTRWYLFPLLYVNFAYFSRRFVEVQDGSYLVMLVTVMAALLAARAGRPVCHALMAWAAVMKLSPLYYVRHLPLMGRRRAATFIVILITGLILPALLWKNYTYIFFFHEELKGGRGGLVAGLLFGGLFSVTLAYVETRRPFDLEEKIGWSLVPVAMFLAMKMNVPRHLLIVLLVPDKRGWRNLIAAFALLVPAVAPSVRFGATLPIATVLLFGAMAWHLDAIGWRTVLDDARHPIRTLRQLVASPR